MDFLHFGSVSFQPNTNIGHLCEELNNMVGNSIWNACVSNLFAYNLHAPKQLASCKLYTNYCSVHPYKRFPSGTLFCSKQSHRMFRNVQCRCKLCVKAGPASLKSQCVNKLCQNIKL